MIKGKDIFLLEDGSTYHLGVKEGDIYGRILTVGPHQRADMIAQLLDTVEKRITSGRDFHIIKGKYKGVGVNIIAIGMGGPMADFMVRECSYVCPKKMACIRLGTCGIFNPNWAPGTVITAGKGCSNCYINHEVSCNRLNVTNDENVESKKAGIAITDDKADHYIVTKPIQGDAELDRLLLKNLKECGVEHSYPGLNNTSDTFFSCQGRVDAHFDDRDNSNVLKSLIANSVDSCEMETFTLFYLAKCRKVAPLAAAACHIGVVNRVNPEMTVNISKDELKDIELKCGRAALEALIAYPLDS